MEIRNWYLFFGVLIQFICAVGLLYIILFRQLKELKKEKNGLTKYRYIIIALQVSAFISAAIGLPRSIQLMLNRPAENFYGAFNAVNTRVALLAAFISWALGYYFVDKENRKK